MTRINKEGVELKMIPRQLEFRDLVQALRYVLEWRGPDFVYQSLDPNTDASVACRYSLDDGETGACLYGVAFFDVLGFPYESYCEGSMHTLFRELGLDPFEQEKMVWLQSLQAIQDRAATYSHVMVLFDEGLKRWERELSDISSFAQVLAKYHWDEFNRRSATENTSESSSDLDQI